jgi:predicted NBD/HSP70 family sugar kinase
MSKINKHKVYLGLDFGGTKLLIGEMTSGGEILNAKKYPSGYMNQREAADLLIKSLDDYFAERQSDIKPSAMGIGLVGRVDSRQGLWFEMDRQRNESMPIAGILQKHCGLPCFADNDVKSAARAELKFGYGRKSKNFVYINIGTGIASGTVSDGKILYGSSFNAGETGHTSSGVKAGIHCICGRDDCIEAIASGAGFDACARLYAPRFPHTTLSIPADGRVNTREIFAMYEKDELCNLLVSQAAEAAANLIMNLVRMSDPDTIVLGGGLISDGFLLARIREKLNAHTMRYVYNGVVLTELAPEYAGLIGACTVAMNE